MKVIYGNDITDEIIEGIADLDAEVFDPDSDEFVGDASMSRDVIISLLQKSRISTVVVLDDNNVVIGYLQTFAMKKDFEDKYKKGEVTFHELDGSKLLDYNEKSINLYLWSVAIKNEYRGKKIPDPQHPNQTTYVIRLLHEGLIDAIVDLKKQGCTITKILGEAVSKKGDAFVKRFCGENSLIHADEENKFYMYESDFNPDCEAFKKCGNVKKLKDAYN